MASTARRPGSARVAQLLEPALFLPAVFVPTRGDHGATFLPVGVSALPRALKEIASSILLVGCRAGSANAFEFQVHVRDVKPKFAGSGFKQFRRIAHLNFGRRATGSAERKERLVICMAA